MAKREDISAERILRTVNDFYTELWPLWMREKMLISFYNGGLIPSDSDDTCEEPRVSLGLGYRYIKKPYENLMDAIIQDPGYIKTKLRFPINPRNKSKVEGAADKEINAITQNRMESAIRKAAGRAIITGRAFFYRTSRWNALFKTGRLLHALSDTDDVYSDAFREWAFTGQIGLDEIDEHLENTRDYEDYGWNHEGLAALKKYILKTTAANKEGAAEEIEQHMLRPFVKELVRRPLDVYWYFRKNGERSDLGYEKIDLYCVSRWGQEQSIDKIDSHGGITYKSMSIKQGEGVEEQILYHLPDAFLSVDECLIPALLDSRVDGEQEMAQIDGTGKIMVPRLMMMEHIALAVSEGVAFSVQPNWTSDGKSITEDEIRRIQKEGINPFDYLPAGINFMRKDNALTGVNAAMELLAQTGVSLEQDAATGELPANGGDQARFKAQAQQWISQTKDAATRRGARFNVALDLMAEQQTLTLCRPLDVWNEGDASFYSARVFQTKMFQFYGIMPQEYSPQRMEAKCRRLAINGDRQQAIQTGQYVLSTLGPTLAPEAQRFFGKEIIRAAYDDSVADMSYPEAPEEQTDQIEEAIQQSTAALTVLQPPARKLSDVPKIHVPVHTKILMTHLQAAQQQGSQTPVQQKGYAALLAHLAHDAEGLLPAEQKQIRDQLIEMAQAIKTIPVSGAMSEIAIKERKQQLSEENLKFSMSREQNLQGDRQQKLALKKESMDTQKKQMGFQQWMALKQHLQQQKNDGVKNASAMLDMINEASDHAPQPQEQVA